MYISCIFFSTAGTGTDNCCLIFVVATFFLVPSMQQVMAENIIVDEQPEKLHGQDHRP